MKRTEPTARIAHHIIEVLELPEGGVFKVLEKAGATDIVQLSPWFFSATLSTDVADALTQQGKFRCQEKVLSQTR